MRIFRTFGSHAGKHDHRGDDAGARDSVNRRVADTDGELAERDDAQAHAPVEGGVDETDGAPDGDEGTAAAEQEAPRPSVCCGERLDDGRGHGIGDELREPGVAHGLSEAGCRCDVGDRRQARIIPRPLGGKGDVNGPFPRYRYGVLRCTSCGAGNEEEARFCVECGSRLEPARAPVEDPFLGRTLADRYRLVRELGAGAMGTVYLAEQKMGTATRHVAVKVLRLDVVRDREMVTRFYRECEMVVQLQHPNAIEIYDFGELPEGGLFFVMEYVGGESLADLLERQGALPADRVERILVQIGGALQEAHTHGIVHRDLKPENVMIATRGGQPDFVKVLDFGIAKRVAGDTETSATVTQRGTVIGTPPYMSPEQLRGEAVDARSDVYSFGVLGYQMLTGRLPFDASSLAGWAYKHMSRPPAPLDEDPAAAQAPVRLRLALMHALAKTPQERPSDLLTLLRELTGEHDMQGTWARMSAGAGLPPAAGSAESPEPDVSGAAQLPGARKPWWGLVAGLLVLGAGTTAVVALTGRSGSGSSPAPASSAADEPAHDASPPDRRAEGAVDGGVRWMRSIHHVSNASNAQNVFMGPDAYARIRPRGFITLQTPDGKRVEADGTDAAEVVVHAEATDGASFRVDMGADHHGLRSVVRDREFVAIDLDARAIGGIHYVRVKHLGGGGEVRLAGVELSSGLDEPAATGDRHR